MSKLVSVIIPVYNAEKYIVETINSVLKQTYQNFEIITCDDASSDSSIEKLENMGKRDPRIINIKNEQNIGKAATVNKLFSMARGEYICILDADDLFSDYKLMDQVTFLDNHEEIDLVYGDAESFQGDKIIYKINSPNFSSASEAQENMKQKYNQECPDIHEAYKIILDDPNKVEFIPASSVMFRRKILEDGLKMDSELRNSEDYDFWLSVIGHGYKIAKIDKIMYLYRIHENQKSKNQDKMKIATDYIIKKLLSGKYFK